MKTDLGRTHAYIISEEQGEQINILIEIDSSLSPHLKFLTFVHETFHVILKIFQLRFVECSTKNCSFLHEKWDFLWFYITWFLFKIGFNEVKISDYQ